MIADPDLPDKAAGERISGVVPCIACNLCFSRLYYHQPIMCTVRPSLGHEGDPTWGYYGFAPAKEKKRIGVVGGGPAGLQVAAVAAERGHEVLLWERHVAFGGSILLASRIDDGDDELLRPIAYLEGKCRDAGVALATGTTSTPEMLKGLGLDVLVLSVGSLFGPGQGSGRLRPDEIIMGNKRPGERVLIAGGDGVGLAIAVYLLRTGEHDITIVEESARLGRDVSPFYLWRYLKLFRERGVDVLTRTVLKGWEGGTASITSAKGDRMVEVDDVVVASRLARPEEGEAFASSAAEVFLIGDARRPRRLHNAIHEAYRLGMRI
jgi:2,4-dienoyl-CoA reductase (NADPH2)